MSSLDEYVDRLREILESRGYRLVGDYGKDELDPETSIRNYVENYGSCIAYANKRFYVYDSSMGETALLILWRSYGMYQPLGSGTFEGVSSVVLTSESSWVAKREVSRKTVNFYTPFEVSGYTGAVLGAEMGEITLYPPMIVYTKGFATRAYLDVSVEVHVTGDPGTLFKCEAGFEMERVLVFSRRADFMLFDLLNLIVLVMTAIMLVSSLRTVFE